MIKSYQFKCLSCSHELKQKSPRRGFKLACAIIFRIHLFELVMFSKYTNIISHKKEKIKEKWKMQKNIF